MQENIPHVPVLFQEVVEKFSSLKEGIIIDCTMGYAGHSSLLLESNPHIKLIGIDQDKTAIEFSKKRLAKFANRVEIKQGRFSQVVQEILQSSENIVGILADIGVSSLQLDQKERGFSFESDYLDMRMDPLNPKDAKMVVNEYSQNELEKIIKEYGELKNYKMLAQVILKHRPFSSAKELTKTLLPYLPKKKKIHPATLLFQAIRIEVNDELKELETLLDVIENSTLTNTRVGIISFHSLEDRIIKHRFMKWARSCICPPEVIRCECGNNHALGKIITKKPITASAEELLQNPRSRSAKLRIFDIER